VSLNFGINARRRRRLHIRRLPPRPFATSTFAVARSPARQLSWKTITYRWLWIFRGGGSALFRSRECYGVEFSTVLFPLRHVPSLLRFAVSRGSDREEKKQTRLRGPSPGWIFSDFLACLPGHEWDEATEAKIQEPNRAGDVNFLALSSLMGFSSPLSLEVFPQPSASWDAYLPSRY